MTNDVRVLDLRRSLESFDAPTVKAEDARQAMLSLLDSSAAPFDREADIHHFTASAIVFSDRGVLLHKHKRSGDWLQPGGHIDSGESPVDAAARETLEETGILPVHPASGSPLVNVDVHHTVNGHVHYDLAYLFIADGTDPAPPEGESQEVDWFSEEKALEMTDDVCRNLILTAKGHSVR
jgi:8-oxo-dGTP pyrophosphatase MutT (NUDIX family)